MSLQNIQDNIGQIYRTLMFQRGSPLRRSTEFRFMHEVYVNFYDVGNRTALAITEAIQYNNNVTTEGEIKASELIDIAYDIGTEWIGQIPTTIRQRFYDSFAKEMVLGNGIVIVSFGRESMPDPISVQALNRRFRSDVFNRWKTTIIGQNTNLDLYQQVDRPELDASGNKVFDRSGSEQIETSRFSKLLGQRTAVSHSQDTKVSTASFIQFLEDPGIAGGSVNVSSENVALAVFNELGIYWRKEEKMIPGADGISRPRRVWVITADMASYNPPYERGRDLGQAWITRILAAVDNLLNDQAFIDKWHPDMQTSVPLLHTVANAELKRVADEILGKGGFTKGGQRVKVKNLPKAPKKLKPMRGNVKNPLTKKTKKTKKIRIPREASKSSKTGNEHGQGRQASTAGAAELARQKAYINSRLPAEVRRNMGRPALRNQEGTFSDSVKLKSLHQAAKTVVAKYTYQLDPYATFENQGKRRWPLGYNPKLLIAKSLKNLAQGRIEQKLTVRRV